MENLQIEEILNGVIKFRQPLFNNKWEFERFNYWGFFEWEGFKSPVVGIPWQKEIVNNQFLWLYDKKKIPIYVWDIIEIYVSRGDYTQRKSIYNEKPYKVHGLVLNVNWDIGYIRKELEEIKKPKWKETKERGVYILDNLFDKEKEFMWLMPSPDGYEEVTEHIKVVWNIYQNKELDFAWDLVKDKRII